MPILGLLGMYFDAVVVEVENYFFFQIVSGCTVVRMSWIGSIQLFLDKNQDACYLSKVSWHVLFGLVWLYSTNQNQYNKGTVEFIAAYLQQ